VAAVSTKDVHPDVRRALVACWDPSRFKVTDNDRPKGQVWDGHDLVGSDYSRGTHTRARTNSVEVLGVGGFDEARRAAPRVDYRPDGLVTDLHFDGNLDRIGFVRFR
jgi:hypothetical protein